MSVFTRKSAGESSFGVNFSQEPDGAERHRKDYDFVEGLEQRLGDDERTDYLPGEYAAEGHGEEYQGVDPLAPYG